MLVIDIIEVVVFMVMYFGYKYLVVIMLDWVVLMIEDCLKLVGFFECCVLVWVSGMVVFELEVEFECVV